MPYLQHLTTLVTLLLSIQPVSALSVSKSAAIGIGVGIGSLLLLSLIAVLYLKFSPARRAERRAKREHGEVTSNEAIEFHQREQAKNFNIWDYDQNTHNKVIAAKKKAEQERHGEVERVA